VFVLAYQGRANAATNDTNVAEHNLRAKVLDAEDGVFILEWSPPPSMRQIVLPVPC